MNCRSCGYLLWNIRARVCPECGSAFRPSAFEFARNAVQFCCPHCGQDYYGQGECGHLVPESFDCVRCGEHISMDEMVLLPTRGIEDKQTQPLRMPWRSRPEIGFRRAWTGTILRGMFAPGELMRADPGPSVLSAWAYLLVTLLISQIPLVAILGVLAAIPSARFFIGPVATLGLAGVVFAVVLLLFWGVITHALLKVSGPLRYGMGGTFQAILYTGGPNIILLIPAFSFYLAPVAWIWWVITATLAIKERHRVTPLRAVVCTLIPPILVGLGIVGAVVSLVMMASSAVTTARVTAAGLNQRATQTLTTALVDAHVESGVWLAHPLELVVDDVLRPKDFLAPLGGSTMSAVSVGGGPLSDLVSADAEGLAVAIEEDLDTIGERNAYRVADFVFTYRGLGPTPSPGLWVVVAWPDPQASRGPVAWQETVWVGLTDGTVTSFDSGLFDGELQTQNLLREQDGLEPLVWPE